MRTSSTTSWRAELKARGPGSSTHGRSAAVRPTSIFTARASSPERLAEERHPSREVWPCALLRVRVRPGTSFHRETPMRPSPNGDCRPESGARGFAGGHGLHTVRRFPHIPLRATASPSSVRGFRSRRTRAAAPPRFPGEPSAALSASDRTIAPIGSAFCLDPDMSRTGKRGRRANSRTLGTFFSTSSFNRAKNQPTSRTRFLTLWALWSAQSCRGFNADDARALSVDIPCVGSPDKCLMNVCAL